MKQGQSLCGYPGRLTPKLRTPEGVLSSSTLRLRAQKVRVPHYLSALAAPIDVWLSEERGADPRIACTSCKTWVLQVCHSGKCEQFFWDLLHCPDCPSSFTATRAGASRGLAAGNLELLRRGRNKGRSAALCGASEALPTSDILLVNHCPCSLSSPRNYRIQLFL